MLLDGSVILGRLMLNGNRLMWEHKRISPRVEPVCKVALLLLTLFVASCRFGSFGSDVRSEAKRMKCETNLRTLYSGLASYISLYSDLPRGRDGQVSIDSFTESRVQKKVGIDYSVLRCPADKNSARPSYVLNPALSVTDLGPNSATVIACDRVANHFGAQTHNGIRLVLIGDGSTVRMDLPQKEQEEWYRLFLSGDNLACTVAAKDGAKGNWTSTEIMWYVGKDQGYVPNE